MSCLNLPSVDFSVVAQNLESFAARFLLTYALNRLVPSGADKTHLEEVCRLKASFEVRTDVGRTG